MTAPDSSDASNARVLVVCTGNVCRSPFVHLVLADALRKAGSPITVESAGTQALVGESVDPRVSATLGERGIDASGFTGRQLETHHVRRSGLILTASREHRTAVVRLDASALGRVFTLRQMARLLHAAGPSLGAAGLGAVELAHAAAKLRGIAGPSGGDDDDVQDPHGLNRAHYATAISLMTPAIDAVVMALTGSGAPRGDSG